MDPLQSVLEQGNGEKKGDPTVTGYTAEHPSWRNPGRVRKSLRTPPPGTMLTAEDCISLPFTPMPDDPPAAMCADGGEESASEHRGKEIGRAGGGPEGERSLRELASGHHPRFAKVLLEYLL